MTPEQLQAIRERNERRKGLKAETSPGTWLVGFPSPEFHQRATGCRGKCRNIYTDDGSVSASCTGLDADDVEFIAAAHNDAVEADVDVLLAEIDRLQTERLRQ